MRRTLRDRGTPAGLDLEPMHSPPPQAISQFDEALRLHQNGQLAEAEAAYLEILATEPSHPGSLHLLGVIRQQQGRHEEALELVGRAIAGAR